MNKAVFACLTLISSTFSVAMGQTTRDFTNDGVPEVLVVSPQAHVNFLREGEIKLLNGATQSPIWTLLGGASGYQLGYAVETRTGTNAAEDMLIYSVPGKSGQQAASRGTIECVKLSTGITEWTASSGASAIGTRLCVIPDHNGDGFSDVLAESFVGVAGSESPAVVIISSTDGQVLREMSGSYALAKLLAQSGVQLFSRADFDADGHVSAKDFADFADASSAPQPDTKFDLNADGHVDTQDLQVLLDAIQAGAGDTPLDRWPLGGLAIAGQQYELAFGEQAPSGGQVDPDDCLPCMSATGIVANPVACHQCGVSVSMHCPTDNVYVGESFRMDIDYQFDIVPGFSWQNITAVNWILPPEVVLSSTSSGTPQFTAITPGYYSISAIVVVGDCCFALNCSFWASDVRPLPPCDLNSWLAVDIEGCAPPVIIPSGTFLGAVLPGQTVVLAPTFFRPDSPGIPQFPPDMGTVSWEVTSGLNAVTQIRRMYETNNTLRLAAIADEPVLITVTFTYKLYDGCEIGDTCSFWVSPDTDNDMLLDIHETLSQCTLITEEDTDQDGVPDGSEVWISKTNPCDPNSVDATGRWFQLDSDNDGLSDREERQGFEMKLTGFTTPRRVYTSSWRYDTDGDGVNDYTEALIGSDPNDASVRGGWGVRDIDRDGLSDLYEQQRGMNAASRDSDGDGIADGIEVQRSGLQGILDPLVPNGGPGAPTPAEGGGIDSDGDGISDGDELQIGTNPTNPDTDYDGILDGDEELLGSDPLSFDSDGDGLSDGFESAIGLNPLNNDTDSDGLLDFAEDDDGDGYDNFAEEQNGTDSSIPDAPPSNSANSVQYTLELSIGPRIVPSGPHQPHQFHCDHWGVKIGSSTILRLRPGQTSGTIFIPSRFIPDTPTALSFELVYLGLDQNALAEGLTHSAHSSQFNDIIRSVARSIDPPYASAEFFVDGHRMYPLLPGLPDRSRHDLTWSFPLGAALVPGSMFSEHCFFTNLLGYPSIRHCWNGFYLVPAIIDPLTGTNYIYIPNGIVFHDLASYRLRPRQVDMPRLPNYIVTYGRERYNVRTMKQWGSPFTASISDHTMSTIDLHCWRSYVEDGALPYRLSYTPDRFANADESVYLAPDPAMGITANVAADGVSPLIIRFPHGIRYQASLLRISSLSSDCTGSVTSGASQNICRILPNASLPARVDFGHGDWSGLSICYGREQTAAIAKPKLHGSLLNLETPGGLAFSADITSRLPTSQEYSFFTSVDVQDSRQHGLLVFVPPDSYSTTRNNRVGISANPISDDDGLDVACDGDMAKDDRTFIAIRIETLDGTFVRNFFVDVCVVKPPMVLVHGINSSAYESWQRYGYWDTGRPNWIGDPSDGDLVGAWPGAELSFVDYTSTATLGYSENFHNIPRTIQQTLLKWRPWDLISPSSGDPNIGYYNSFEEEAVAATRVDLIAHSMGAQLARFYISEVLNPDLTSMPRVAPRVWENLPAAALPPIDLARQNAVSDQSWRRSYLRAENFQAGDIRRLVSLGSPFKGSCQANVLGPVFAIPNWLRVYPRLSVHQDGNDDIMTVSWDPTPLTRDEFFSPSNMSPQIEAIVPAIVAARNELYPNGVFRMPVGTFDLMEHSDIQVILESSLVRYPTGAKKVLWAPATATADNADSALWNLARRYRLWTVDGAGFPLFNCYIGEGVIGQNNKLCLDIYGAPGIGFGQVYSVSECVAGSLAADTSDTVVSIDSQRAGYDEIPGQAIEFMRGRNTSHTRKPSQPQLNWETHSRPIRKSILSVLERPSDFEALGADQLFFDPEWSLRGN